MANTLKPFYINQNDLSYLLAQVNFVPLFDGPANSNGIVNFDPLTMDAWDAKGVQVWSFSSQSGAYAGVVLSSSNVALLGHGFPQVSSSIGIRDVSGLHNNLFGDQAFWGTVDVPFRREVAADYDNYVTSPGANYDPNALSLNVTDFMPRIISRTITTGGVNLLTEEVLQGDAVVRSQYVVWDAARYATDAAYATLIDSAGFDTPAERANLVQGAKIVAPVTTEVNVLDNNGAPLMWVASTYSAAQYYTATLAIASAQSLGGLVDASGGALTEGEAIYFRPYPFNALVNTLQTYQPDVLVYKQLIDANVDFSTGAPLDGTLVTTTLTESGYGLLETLGHIDFQNPGSGEFFIGSENPGVAPVNSWFGIFGQFFDHGLDKLGAGGNGKITIALDPGDPLYRAPGTDGPLDPGNTKITVTRATISGTDANNDAAYINHTSPFIDQSQTYGSHDQLTDLLRKWVSTDGGLTFHAGMELFDGTTLVDAWERRWPDDTSTMVHDTLPTLSELRNHVADTGREELTWDDVSDLRNRDADGDVIAGNSGSPLLLDMNPLFDAAHLASTQEVGASAGDTVAARVTAAVLTLNTNIAATITGLSNYAANNPARAGGGDVLSQNSDGTLDLYLDEDLSIQMGAGPATVIPAGHYGGANAMMLWVDFSSFAIMSPPPVVGSGAPDIHGAVGEILMATVGDHYIAGDGRVNENFGLTSIHHVFHEEHNFQVENLKTWIYAHDANNSPVDHAGLHAWQESTGKLDTSGNYVHALNVHAIAGPGDVEVFDPTGNSLGYAAQADVLVAWDPDKMFEATKLVVEMEYQHAAVDQYARTITPRIQEFVGYSTGVDSTISLEYAQVAFRFGHSTIRETIDTLDPSGWMFGTVTRYALEKAFLNPQGYAEEGVAAITLGLSRQQMNEVDEFITPALNQGLLGQPLDLASINIARGRDMGIPTLNDFREGISLARYTSWADFGANMIHPESLVNFIAAYSFNGDVGLAQAAMLNSDFMNNVGAVAGADGFNHIDSWIGGLAEAHVPGGLLGETFDAIFVAQIQSLMDGDRFYYLYRLFGTNIHEEVNNGQFKDIVERNTGLSHLNGSIFAYADKYYDFNRGQDGTLTDTNGDHANHLYADVIAAGGKGIYSDGGDSTSANGSIISVTGSDFIRPDVTLDYIRDVRPEIDPTQVHTVEGTPTSGADSHEVIVATDNVDYIHARAGDDTVYGEGGDDFIFGDGGIDRLYGGDGNDMLDSGEGPDLVDGGAGKDVIYGRGSGSEVGGFDQLVGGSGNDLVIGGEGIDKLSGGSGDDIIYGDGLTNPEMGNTDAFTHGGDGNDYIDTGASGDLLYGEEGDDYLVGGIDQDLMQGGVGDDILRPGSPSQAINGGPDEVIGDDGFANSGFDLVDFSDYVANAPGVTIDFTTQNNPLPAIDGITPFPAWFQIEGAIGTRNNDTFIGDSAGAATATVSLGNNWLIGGSGNDTFTGAGGNDLIVGGSIRLDQLIGKYAGADNGTLALGSTAWLADAMATGTGGTGYSDNSENAYTGASNRATGDLDASGLLSAAGMNDLSHFQEMLRSRMFKDVTLGDGSPDGSDTVVFSGNRFDYSVDVVNGPSGIVAYKITDLTGTDGVDLVTGVEHFKFADVTLSGEAELLNGQPAFATPTAAFSVAENVPLAGTASASDGDFLPLAYSISGGADAARFAIDAATGALSFLAAADFESPTDAGANNIYDVVVRVSDTLGAFDEQAVSVTVTNAQEGGSISASMAGYSFSNAGNVTLNLGSSISDPDTPLSATSFTWTRTGGNANPASAVNQSGVFSVSPGTQVSTFSLEASYTDALGAVTTDSLGAVVNVGTSNANTFTATGSSAYVFGLGGADVLTGTVGDDTINGGAGSDTISGGGGDDTLAYNVRNSGGGNSANGGRDFIDGGAHSLGGDRFVLTGNNQNETFRIYTAGAATAAGITGLNANTEIVITRNGTSNGSIVAELNNIEEITINTFDATANDGNGGVNGGTIGGGDSIQVIGDFTTTSLNYSTITVNGGDGDDTVDITGLTSDHRIVFNSGTGNDHVVGNLRPQDVVDSATVQGGPTTGGSQQGGNTATASSQSVVGTDGNDVLRGTNGANVISAGAGNDLVFGGAEQMDVTSGDGNDIVFGGDGSDRLFGDAGNDQVFGEDGSDRIWGNDGNDMLEGGDGDDSIFAGQGNDVVEGGRGTDKVYGGAGNDTFVASSGDGAGDHYYGEDGNDTLDLSLITARLSVDLRSSGALGFGSVTTAGDVDTISGIENVVLGSNADSVTASNDANHLSGGGGDDTFAFRSAAAANGDRIADFQTGDVIDLRFIDSVDGGGDNDFTMSVARSFNTSGQPVFTGSGQLLVHFDAANQETVLLGNTNGSLDAEFRIVLEGGNHIDDLLKPGAVLGASVGI